MFTVLFCFSRIIHCPIAIKKSLAQMLRASEFSSLLGNILYAKWGLLFRFEIDKVALQVFWRKELPQFFEIKFRDRHRGRKTIPVSTASTDSWSAGRKQLVSALFFKCSVSRPCFKWYRKVFGTFIGLHKSEFSGKVSS